MIEIHNITNKGKVVTLGSPAPPDEIIAELTSYVPEVTALEPAFEVIEVDKLLGMLEDARGNNRKLTTKLNGFSALLEFAEDSLAAVSRNSIEGLIEVDSRELSDARAAISVAMRLLHGVKGGVSHEF